MTPQYKLKEALEYIADNKIGRYNDVHDCYIDSMNVAAEALKQFNDNKT